MAAKEKQVAAAASMAPAAGSSYLEWGAVCGGVAVAAAITVILMQFGAAVGLSAGDVQLADGSTSWNVLVAGLWMAVVALASSMAGGYIAGRMRSRWGDAKADEVEFRDGVHGLVVWAVATLLVAIVTGLLSALASIGATAAVAGTEAQVSNDVMRLTHNISSIFAFATAAGSAIGAAAAWFAAQMGGTHRDEGIATDTIVPVFLRKS